MINHLFLPHHLPGSCDADYLIRDDHRYEHEILESMEEYLGTLKAQKFIANLFTFTSIYGTMGDYSEPGQFLCQESADCFNKFTTRRYFPTLFSSSKCRDIGGDRR